MTVVNMTVENSRATVADSREKTCAAVDSSKVTTFVCVVVLFGELGVECEIMLF